MGGNKAGRGSAYLNKSTRGSTIGHQHPHVVHLFVRVEPIDRIARELHELRLRHSQLVDTTSHHHRPLFQKGGEITGNMVENDNHRKVVYVVSNELVKVSPS